jgi:DNA modification methylase
MRVAAADAADFLPTLEDGSVDLFLVDPPYYKIVRDLWDHQWESPEAYASWLVGLCDIARRKVSPRGSLILFQAMGKQGQHPVFDVVKGVERSWTFRNWITWRKSRAFGGASNYLYCRDEIVWFSASSEPEGYIFNTPHLDEAPSRRSKNDKKRVTNIWTDIAQEFRPARVCQRPMPLMARLIQAHSHPGSLVVDFCAGFGTTGIVAAHLGRRFLGCEANAKDAELANGRVERAEQARLLASVR